MVTLAILKKSLSDFFHKSLSARWIHRDQLQLEQNRLGELSRPHAKLPNMQNASEISPVKFCRVTVNVAAPLHKQLYYIITLRRYNQWLRLYMNHVRSAQSAVLKCQPHTPSFEMGTDPSEQDMGGSAALILFLNVGSSSSGSVCDLGPVCVCWFLLGCLVFFLRTWKKKHTNQNFKKDTHSACICLNTVHQYIFSRHLWLSSAPFPLEQLSFVGFCVFSVPLSFTDPFLDSLSCCKCI